MTTPESPAPLNVESAFTQLELVAADLEAASKNPDALPIIPKACEQFGQAAREIRAAVAALRSRPPEAAPLRCEHGRIPTACPHCGTMPSGPVEGETPETDAMQYDIDNPPKSWQKLYEHACRLERRLRAPRQDPRRRCLDGHLVEDDGTCETCKVEAELVNLRSRPADGEVAEALKAADGKSHLDDWYGCYLHAKHARTLAAAYRSKAEECERVRGDADLLDFIQKESMTLESFDIPTGGGDSDIGWRILQWYMGEDKAREIAVVYEDDARAAIRAARAQLSKEGT